MNGIETTTGISPVLSTAGLCVGGRVRLLSSIAFERSAKVCETAEVPIDIDVWMGTKKTLTAATAIGLADAIRALAKEAT
jgi:hypothetical protein